MPLGIGDDSNFRTIDLNDGNKGKYNRGTFTSLDVVWSEGQKSQLEVHRIGFKMDKAEKSTPQSWSESVHFCSFQDQHIASTFSSVWHCRIEECNWNH